MTKWLRLLPALFWMFVIWRLSAMPIIQGDHRDWLDFILKKSAHVTEYAILYALLRFGLEKTRFHKLPLFIALIYAFLDETHQLFVPGRGGTLRDAILFDTLGAFLSFRYFRRRHG